MTLKTSNRLPDYLDPMRQAIADALDELLTRSWG